MIKAEDFDIQTCIIVWNQHIDGGSKELTSLNNNFIQIKSLQNGQISSNKQEQINEFIQKCETSLAKLNEILSDLNKIVIISGDTYSKEKQKLYDAQADDEDDYSKLSKLEKFMEMLESAYQVCQSCVKKFTYDINPTELQLILSRWQLGQIENELFAETFDAEDLQL
ncbi:hypothetical protein TTHERM_01055560 (macronuclear) [Tetrahymena thermophila SB210]|uniref:Uncharacterized protein n=1 Tax=Tetrahymena thermophila (strain SB210) TaxID=312017 RepID=Q24HN1_TETTS|nr:hypothetical protein TTHERM_01055560 [Tetrahymena thermophila SB210]EAS07280.3 hypothetical protein TTHERM_01055560 [Tetrahymena thermophila SB210]|eukprot:XP_001027522.3 hypothetical protein TTHERM_01055560 [Tetrahymena thermophila SB210]